MNELDNVRRRGIVLETAVDANRLLKVIERFKPVQTQHELMRVGPELDGGYLIPDDIEGITTCFSASSSVDSSAAFELDLFESFNINSHLVNNSMEEAPGYIQPLTFVAKFLSAINNNMYLTLDSWVKGTLLVTEYENYDLPLLLKLDIGGDEYSSILSASEDVLKRFRIVVLKLNNVDQWGHPSFFKVVEDFTNKLLEHFIVVHIHPSNKVTIKNVNGIDLPEMLEITLLSKKRCNILGPVSSLPDELDKPCDPNIKDIVLPDVWFK